jgi:pimeloyl-ACP methyl ester carboxylesterase
MGRARTSGTPGELRWRGHRLAYEVRGDGPGTVVLVHGLLLPRHVNGPWASALADRGHRVVLFDLLGHGESDKPMDPTLHRLDEAADQVLALLDHLGEEQVVLGGMSLGANVSLQVATSAPERIAGLLVEMPVLERGAIGVLLQLAPLWALLRFGGWPVRTLFGRIRRGPRTGIELLDAVLDTADDPRAMATVLHGYASGPTAPARSARERISLPTLIIGHGYDWIHPIDDARALARELPLELPWVRMIRAHNILELRTRPERLVAEIAEFVEEALTGRGAAPVQATAGEVGEVGVS